MTHCTGAPRPVRWSPHARVFQRAVFFYILRPSPSGCAFLFSIVLFFSPRGLKVLYYLQRYRREGLRKRFRLTISAPLPADFIEICRDLNLDLPEDVIQGGTFIDGERLEGEEIPGVGGRWAREV